MDELREQFYASPGKEHVEHARDLMYKYKKDDQIFPHNVAYTGDKNAVVKLHEQERLYHDEHPVFRQVNDDRICYSSSLVNRQDANAYLTELRAKKRAEDKANQLVEEQKHLKRLVEIEDVNVREDERRRDYRKQVDDYHRVLDHQNRDLSKKERAERLRDGIVAENEHHIREEEGIRNAEKEYKKSYGRQLDGQLGEREQKITRGELMHDAEEMKNTGLQIGNYQAPDRTEWMNGLNQQMNEKNSRLDQWRDIDVKDGNWLAHKQNMDYYNYNYNHDHRRIAPRPDNSTLLEQKDATIRENARKRNGESNE